VSKLGLGCFSLTGAYGSAALDDEAAGAVIAHAFRRGVTFFDTSDIYDQRDPAREGPYRMPVSVLSFLAIDLLFCLSIGVLLERDAVDVCVCYRR